MNAERVPSLTRHRQQGARRRPFPWTEVRDTAIAFSRAGTSILVSDFQRFHLCDLKGGNEWEFPLMDLHKHIKNAKKSKKSAD